MLVLIDSHQVCSLSTGSLSIGKAYCSISSDNSKTCSCEEFLSTGDCIHLRALASSLCTWKEGYSPEVQTDEQKANMICPICGSPTTLYELWEEQPDDTGNI